MAEIDWDIVWLSLLVFLPSAFALVLLFFPKGTEEYMRWWTLLGTAATFVVSAIVFIQYLGMLARHRDEAALKVGENEAAITTSLAERASAADKRHVKGDPSMSGDLV